MRTHNLESLLRLCGMAYHGGKPAEHWIALVGIDPREVVGIHVIRGLCYWTPEAERVCKERWSELRELGHRLGVA